MLEKRVAELKAQNSRLFEVQSVLQRSLNFVESMLTALPTPVFYKNTEGRYQGCNKAFTEIMGVTPEQIRGKAMHELWPSELHSIIIKWIWSSCRNLGSRFTNLR